MGVCSLPEKERADAAADVLPDAELSPSSIDEGCCEVGPLFPLDDPASQGGIPSIVWNGAEWMVTWGDFDGRLNQVRPVSLRVRPESGTDEVRVTLDLLNLPMSIALGPEGYGLMLAPEPAKPKSVARVALVDVAGNLKNAIAIESASEGGAIARYAPVGGWAVATQHIPGESLPHQGELRIFDDALVPLPARVQLGEIQDADWRPLEVIGFPDRVTTIQGQGYRSILRTFVGPDLTEPFAPTTIGAHSTMGAAKVGDKVFVAANVHNILQTWIYDPQRGFSFGGSSSRITISGSRTLGVSGDDLGMTVGICFPHESRAGVDADAVRFVAMDAQRNTALGNAVTVAAGLRYAAACAVAAGPRDEYLLVIWNAAKESLDEQRPSVLATRIRIRR